MSYTLGTLISNVQAKLDDTGFSSANITQFINDTQREIFNNYALQFVEGTATLTSTANTALISTGIPTDLQIPIDLTVTAPAGYAGLLRYVDFKEIDAAYPGTVTTNIPTRWYSFAGSIYLDPTPNQAFTLTLRYLKRPTELTGASDVPQIPEEFQEILVLGALKRCLQLNDSYDQAAVIQINEYDPMVVKLVQRYAVGQQAGPLKIPINRMRTNARS